MLYLTPITKAGQATQILENGVVVWLGKGQSRSL